MGAELDPGKPFSESRELNCEAVCGFVSTPLLIEEANTADTQIECNVREKTYSFTSKIK